MAKPSKFPIKGKQRAAEKPAGGAAETSNPSDQAVKAATGKKTEKVKTRRIHVSGLPSITEQEARDRFKSFGEVLGVDGLGKLDGNGNPLRYAFVDIKTTKSKLSQCMNLLSGSVWKGSTLRIAEAKPTFIEQLDRERQQAARQASREEAGIPKKTKKRKRGLAEAATNAPLVDMDNVKENPGWKLDPKTKAPIFPIIARPDHPLPPIASTSGSAIEKPKKDKKGKPGKDKKEKKKAEKQALAEDPAVMHPPKRARRVKIDPTQWDPKHLRQQELDNLPSTSYKPPIQLAQSTRSNGPTKADVEAEVIESESDSSDTSDEDIAQTLGTSQSGAAKMPQPQPGANGSESDSDEGDNEHDTRNAQLRPNTNPSIAASTDVRNTAVAKEALSVSNDDEASTAERNTHLELLKKMFGGSLPKDLAPEVVEKSLDGEDYSSSRDEDSDNVEAAVEANANEAAPSAVIASESSSEDSGSEEPELGQASTANISSNAIIPPQVTEVPDVETSEDDADQASAVADTFTHSDNAQQASASASSVSTDHEMEEDAIEAEVSSAQPQVDSNVQMQSLTEMFRPQEAAAGFTLGNLLDDFEMDELDEQVVKPMPLPSTSAPRPSHQDFGQQYGQQQSRQSAPPTRALQDDTLFFIFPTDEDLLPGGAYDRMSELEREKLLARSWTGTSEVRRFKRTQTLDEIAAHHESIRKKISDSVRKRHREAVKRFKKHGGKRAANMTVDA